MNTPSSRTAPRRAWSWGAARFALALAATLALSWFLEREEAPANAALALQARLGEAARPRVQVVQIDDSAYARLFGKRSPMDPPTVERIIRAIASAGPAVIGVDVLSPDSAYAGISDSIAGVPIVWVRPFRCPDGEPAGLACLPEKRVLERAAGSDDPGSGRAGAPNLPQEDDGSIRRYERVLRTRSGDAPAFTTVVLRHAGQPAEDEPPGTDRLIRYRRLDENRELTAESVLDVAENGGFPRDNVLRGKIVLLGGTFREGRDSYITPLGELAGVHVLAQILETELDGGGPHPPGLWYFFFIQAGVGVVIFVIFRRLEEKPRKALLVSLAVCVVAAVAASWKMFGSPKMAFYFLPGLSVWLIQQLYDRVKDALVPERAPDRDPDPADPPRPGRPDSASPIRARRGPHPVRAPLGGGAIIQTTSLTGLRRRFTRTAERKRRQRPTHPPQPGDPAPVAAAHSGPGAPDPQIVESSVVESRPHGEDAASPVPAAAHPVPSGATAEAE